MLLNLYVYTVNQEDGHSVLAQTEGEAKRYIKSEYMCEGDEITHFDLMGTDYDTDNWEIAMMDMPDHYKEED